MTSRLSQLLGLKSPVSPPPAEDEWYIPYKTPQDTIQSGNSWGSGSSMPQRSYTGTVAFGGIGQSPEAVYSPTPRSPQRTSLSTIFSTLAVRRSSSAKPNPFRSASAKPAPPLSRSNSAMTYSSSQSKQELRHRPSHSSDFSSNKASWPTHSSNQKPSSPTTKPFLPPPTPEDPQPLRPEFPHVNSKDLLRNKSLRANEDTFDAIQEVPRIHEPSAPVHPYANVFNIRKDHLSYNAPKTAPLPSNSTLLSPPPHSGPSYSRQRVTLNTTSPTDIGNPPVLNSYEPPSSSMRGLKSSMSTPDLRYAPRSLKHKSSKLSRTDSISARLLNAQVWCEAIFLPRPKIKGRAISITPPDSPQTAPAAPSRPLAHSRSLVDLREEPKLMPVTAQVPTIPTVVKPSGGERTLRPKSFALDDLALPSPIPSLSTVLQEGELLQLQRHKWQTMATSSIGNKHSRSLSRARSKSLTQRHKPKEKDGTLTYLAARGILGDQEPIPTSRHNTLKKSRTTQNLRHGEYSVPASSDGHGTGTKSHSRNGSWAKNAIKACVDPDVSPGEERGNALERALQHGETKRILIPDPATAQHHFSMLSPLTPRPPTALVPATRDHQRHPSPGEAPMYIPPWRNPTPQPPSVSPIPPDLQFGIAVNTPPEPLFDDDNAEQEIEYMPSHPYALSAGNYRSPVSRGGINHKKTGSAGSDYAGAHPISVSQYRPGHNPGHNPSASYASRFSAHPYASGSSNRDSYVSESKVIPMIRPDSEIPISEKMWVALSPNTNFAREILPDELHSYSPYGAMTPDLPETVPRQRSGDFSAARSSGLASVQSSRFQRELSVQQEEQEEEDPPSVSRQESSVSPASSHRGWRKPVQYGSIDISRGPFQEADELLPPSPLPSEHRPTEYLIASHGQSSRLTIQTNHTLPSSIGDGIVPHIHADVPTSNQEVATPSKRISPPKLMTSFISPASALSPPSLSPVHEKSGSSGNVSSQNASSPDVTSRGSSPPRPIGSVDDLEDFEDLFYRPNRPSMSVRTGDSFDIDRDSTTRASGLTSIARQLEREFKEMNAELGTLPDSEYEPSVTEALEAMQFRSPSDEFPREPSEDYLAEPRYSVASGLSEREDHTFGFHTIAEEAHEDDESHFGHDDEYSHEDHLVDGLLHRPNFVPFQSTTTLPEDVEHESSRASSPDNEAVFFRVGQVESVTTPPINIAGHRPLSSVGEMSYALPSSVGTEYTIPSREPPPGSDDYFDAGPEPGPSSAPRHSSFVPSSAGTRDSLHPSTVTPRFSTEDGMFRRSYMTTSDTSRMSGLSDFPVPPLHFPPDFGNHEEPVTERPSMIIDSYLDHAVPEEDEENLSMNSTSELDEYPPDQDHQEDDSRLRPPTRPDSSLTSSSDERRMTFGPGALLSHSSERF